MKQTKQDHDTERERLQQELLAREVDEELRQEQLMALWRKYRAFVVGGVIAVLLAVSGFEAYQSWYYRVRLNESDSFENAVLMAYQGDDEAALAAFQHLAAEARTGYRSLAQMQIAGIYLKQGKKTEMLSTLKALMEDTSAPEALRAVATLSYVGHQTDTDHSAELKRLIAPWINNPDSSYYGSAVELSALLSLNAGKQEEAITLLKTALNAPSLAAPTRDRLKTILTLLEREK